MAHPTPPLGRIQTDESLPALVREPFAVRAEEHARLRAQIDAVDAKLVALHRADDGSRRPAKIPGVGPIGAVPPPAPGLFRSGRRFAAWIGSTPRDRSTAGKVRLGLITWAGDEALRGVLVARATAVIQRARRSGRASP